MEYLLAVLLAVQTALWVGLADHGGAERRKARRRGEGVPIEVAGTTSFSTPISRSARDGGQLTYVEHAERKQPVLSAFRASVRHGGLIMKGSRAKACADLTGYA